MSDAEVTLASIESYVSAAYNMVAERGGTVPANKTVSNLGPAIRTIPV